MQCTWLVCFNRIVRLPASICLVSRRADSAVCLPVVVANGLPLGGTSK